MNYYEKYLKYKNKYNSLKNLHGGMKIVINDIVSRDSISVEQFENIFIYATKIETVSINSLTGFIFRITLPENITPFKSDIIDIDGKIMNSPKNILPNTGVKLVDIIFKICIIQEIREPKINNYNMHEKLSCTLQELIDEYHVQRRIYDTSMMNGGIPVCPDVISLLTFSNSKFNCLFIKDQAKLSNIFSKNPIFQYINREVNSMYLPITRSVGIILMESLPSSYKQLKFLRDDPKQTELFLEMSKRVLANYLIIFFRSGLILLDAHLKNWMYDNCQPFNQFKVKAIDFGRALDRNTEINKIERFIRNFFNNKLPDTIKKFAELMDHNSSNISNIYHVANIIRNEMISLNCLIKNSPNGQILWQPDCTPPINITISDTKVMQIDSCMILMHRIFVISAFIDYFHNMSKFNKNSCQMVEILNILFRSRCTNLKDMIKYNLRINLIDYLNYVSPEAKEFTILSYIDIKEHVKNYLEPTPLHREVLDH